MTVQTVKRAQHNIQYEIIQLPSLIGIFVIVLSLSLSFALIIHGVCFQ